MINYILRDITEADYDFIYTVKKEAYKKYVEQIWGVWDESAQKNYFEKFINIYKDKIYIIVYNGQDVGFYNDDILQNGNYEIVNICILPEYRGKGIGTSILKDMLSKYSNRDVEIQYFKQNPVGSLYKKLGFIQTLETDTHYKMIKPKNM